MRRGPVLGLVRGPVGVAVHGGHGGGEGRDGEAVGGQAGVGRVGGAADPSLRLGGPPLPGLGLVLA